jgi:hypothetical protein
MSVRNRLEDALYLWSHGRKEGAWVQVLIAAAATSKERFPNKKDGEAFKDLIRDVTPLIVDPNATPIAGGVNVVFNANTPNSVTMGEVMYKHLRCFLIHEAKMPSDVRLSESKLENGKLVADLRGGSPLTIPDFWVLHLAKAVATAPENAATCGDLFP